jgi:two-component system sensor kinase FixL
LNHSLTSQNVYFVKSKLIKDDRKKTEQLLKKLPGMAYEAFNKTDWPMIFVNEGCSLLTGNAKKQFEGQSILWGKMWGKLIHPDDYDRVYQTINQPLKAKRIFELEYRIITKKSLFFERRNFIEYFYMPF